VGDSYLLIIAENIGFIGRTNREYEPTREWLERLESTMELEQGASLFLKQDSMTEAY